MEATILTYVFVFGILCVMCKMMKIDEVQTKFVVLMKSRQPNKLPFSLPSPCYDLPLQQKHYGIQL